MKKPNRIIVILSLAAVLLFGIVAALVILSSNQSTLSTPDPDATPLVFDNAEGSPRVTFRMDAWADNWFAAYLDESLLVEDRVPITTERSFNAETVTFEASYPLNLNFILKDYKANDSGLEYIGAANQQMGDGGFIMQVTDLSISTVVGVSDDTWRCVVIHDAPLDKSCEDSSNPVAGTPPCDFTAVDEPEGWKSTAYDDSAWAAAQVYTEAAVSPKDGYDQIAWDAAAQLIWGPDLETNNTLLCRVTIEAPAG